MQTGEQKFVNKTDKSVINCFLCSEISCKHGDWKSLEKTVKYYKRMLTSPAVIIKRKIFARSLCIRFDERGPVLSMLAHRTSWQGNFNKQSVRSGSISRQTCLLSFGTINSHLSLSPTSSINFKNDRKVNLCKWFLHIGTNIKRKNDISKKLSSR